LPVKKAGSGSPFSGGVSHVRLHAMLALADLAEPATSLEKARKRRFSHRWQNAKNLQHLELLKHNCGQTWRT
jgi:hypothetical protein